jgi:hypothetical protein
MSHCTGQLPDYGNEYHAGDYLMETGEQTQIWLPITTVALT